MLTHFDHVTVAVSDLEVAVKTYELLLGCASLWRGTTRELGTQAALFGLSDALLELIAPEPEALEAEGLRALLKARGDDLQSICFDTENATQSIAACAHDESPAPTLLEA